MPKTIEPLLPDDPRYSLSSLGGGELEARFLVALMYELKPFDEIGQVESWDMLLANLRVF